MSKSFESSKTRADPAYADAILQYLSSFCRLTPLLEAQLRKSLFQESYKKGEYLLKQGEKAKALYFIASGIVVGYTTRSNKRLTTYICAEGDTVSSISGMYGALPSGESIYVIEDALVLGLYASELLDWMESSIEWNIIVRRILENFYKIAHERSNVIRMGTALEKYAYYALEMPEHIDRIPIKYIADYLNIKPKTLEKILKERQNQNGRQLAEKMYLIVKDYLTVKQGFKQQGLSISAMAAALCVPPHQLSQFINSHYKKSFTAFINTYRVVYLRSRLQRPSEWQHLKIEALGIEGGFSSRSVFFSEFKLRTGMGPAAYAKAIKTVKHYI